MYIVDLTEQQLIQAETEYLSKLLGYTPTEADLHEFQQSLFLLGKAQIEFIKTISGDL